MSDNKVVNFAEQRIKKIEVKKRAFERIMFDDMLGCYAEIDAQGSNHPIKIIDLSHDGCQFQVPKTKNKNDVFKNNTELTIRLYFSKESYLPIIINVKNSREYTDQKGNSFYRYGCQLNKEIPSFKAVETFINFLYQYAEFASVDKGESKVYFL